MARPTEDKAQVLSSQRDCLELFHEGCKANPPNMLRSGLEHEKPLVYEDNNAPVPYEVDASSKKAGIRDLLEYQGTFGGWSAKEENGNIIELNRGRVSLTIEPAGQYEHACTPQFDCHASAKETDRLLQEANLVASVLGMRMVATAFHPTGTMETLPFVPKSRYRQLHKFFGKNAPGGKNPFDLMSFTSTVQVNLGYSSEEDMVQKLRVSLALQPVAVALFANSPFAGGKPTGYQSTRSHLIRNNLGGRYGFMLPVAFEEGFGFERFTQYAMNEMPMIGIYKGETFIDARGGKFSDFIEGKLDAVPGQKATMADWSNHLNTIWPEVRLRGLLEMRGADVGPPEMIKALPALWTGLLYNKQALDAASDMVRDWTREEREALREQTPRTGLKTPFMNGQLSVRDLALQMLDIASAGLKARNVVDPATGKDERSYLEPLYEIATSGRNWAQRLAARYETSWNRDINHLFSEMDYANEPSVLKAYVPAPPEAKKVFVPAQYALAAGGK